MTSLPSFTLENIPPSLVNRAIDIAKSGKLRDMYPMITLVAANAHNQSNISAEIERLVSEGGQEYDANALKIELVELQKSMARSQALESVLPTQAPLIVSGPGPSGLCVPPALVTGMVPIDIDNVMQSLNNPNEGLSYRDQKESYEFEELRNCINTVETALRGTNWEQALHEATRLAFSCLWIGFIMAKHAHPTFPTMADWGVLARMKTPFLTKRCLYERRDRKYGEPQWDASCFHEGQLVLGTDADADQLYLRTKQGRWARVQLEVSADIKQMMVTQLKREQDRYSGEPSHEIDSQIWKLVGSDLAQLN